MVISVQRSYFLKGTGFGISMSVVTILAVVAGFSAVHDLSALITAIVIVGIANAMFDAFGMHVSEELEYGEGERTVWIPMGAFATKFLVAISFVLLVFLLPHHYLIPLFYGATRSWLQSHGIQPEAGANPLSIL